MLAEVQYPKPLFSVTPPDAAKWLTLFVANFKKPPLSPACHLKAAIDRDLKRLLARLTTLSALPDCCWSVAVQLQG